MPMAEFLTPTLILKEFLRLLYQHDVKTTKELPNRQLHFVIDQEKRALSLDDFSWQILTPAVVNVVGMLDGGAMAPAHRDPMLHKMVLELAYEEYEGLEARFIADYMLASDAVLCRVDVWVRS